MIKSSVPLKLFRAANAILMILVCVIVLYPIYYMLIVSLSSGTAVLTGQVKLYPMGLNLRAYASAWKNAYFVNSYKNTVIITVLGTAINLFMTTICAYPLSRKDFYGRKIFMALITFTMFFSGGMIPNYLLVTSLGLSNTYWALVLPCAITVYYMILMRTFFQSIPFAITESAYIDGANDITVLMKLIIPLSKPILGTMVLFYAVSRWNDFYNALLFLSDKTTYPIQLFVRSIVLGGETLSMQMASQAASGGEILSEQSMRYAIIILSILPILVVFPFVSRFFKSGMMIGSIKG